MKNVWKSGAIQSVPSPVGYMEGHPTEGSSVAGTDATVPGAWWYHGITQEIINAILGGGITPDATQLDQLNLSIDARVQAVRNALSEAIAAVAESVTRIDPIPTGTVMWFDLDSPPSNQWLVADGGAISRTTYKNLYQKIGVRHGKGNGSTTFNKPNLIGKVAWGASSGIGGLIEAGLPNIEGGAEYFSWSYVISKSGALKKSDNGTGGGYGDSGRGGERINLKFDASDSNPIYGKSSTVQPPAMKLLPCIHI